MPWCWHRWKKWELMESGYLRAEYDAFTGQHFEDHEKFVNGKFFRQQRVCEKCGKLQVRRISA